MRLLGTDMVSTDTESDNLFVKAKINIHPDRFTPATGFNLGQLATYAACQKSIRDEPTEMVFVSLYSARKDEERTAIGIMKKPSIGRISGSNSNKYETKNKFRPPHA